MADGVHVWCRRFFSDDKIFPKIFILSGPVGTGKSHIANRVHRWVRAVRFAAWRPKGWVRPPTIEFYEWAQIVTLKEEEFRMWLKLMDETDLMFLEDVGAEVDRFKTSEPTERFRQVLNDFRSKWLFVTTNVYPEQWGDRWDIRVQDRLMRGATSVTLRKTPRFTTVS